MGPNKVLHATALPRVSLGVRRKKMRPATKQILDRWEFRRRLKIWAAWAAGLSLLVAGCLYSLPTNTRFVSGTLMHYYYWPSYRRTTKTAFCKVQLDGGPQITAVCSLKPWLPRERVTVEITETYLFGAKWNSVVDAAAQPSIQPDGPASGEFAG